MEAAAAARVSLYVFMYVCVHVYMYMSLCIYMSWVYAYTRVSCRLCCIKGFEYNLRILIIALFLMNAFSR